MTPRERAKKVILSVIISKEISPPLIDRVEQAISAAVEEEREACALICDGHEKDHRSAPEDSPVQYAASEAAALADAIRARSNRKGIDR